MSNQTENVCAPLVDKHDGDTGAEPTVEEVDHIYNNIATIFQKTELISEEIYERMILSLDRISNSINRREEKVEEEEMKSYNGVMMPKYIDGREVVSYPNARKKIKIIKKEEDEEDVCCKYGKRIEEVYQCMECDKYLCVDCDYSQSEMATTCEATMCEPCGKAYEKQLNEDEEQAYKMVCENCEYTLSRYDWGWGKGRIMFNDLEDGKFRCGVCDDRVNDPQGMNPNDEEE